MGLRFIKDASARMILDEFDAHFPAKDPGHLRVRARILATLKWNLEQVESLLAKELGWQPSPSAGTGSAPTTACADSSPSSNTPTS